MDNFVHNLENYLCESNMSQSELARRLGISKSTVSMWINGTNSPRLSVVYDISKIFGCSIGDLLDHDMTPDDIRRARSMARINSVLVELNTDGIEKVMDYIVDLDKVKYGNK